MCANFVHIVYTDLSECERSFVARVFSIHACICAMQCKCIRYKLPTFFIRRCLYVMCVPLYTYLSSLSAPLATSYILLTSLSHFAKRLESFLLLLLPFSFVFFIWLAVRSGPDLVFHFIIVKRSAFGPFHSLSSMTSNLQC